MKKLLVASTALVAFAAVSSAQAADPIKLSISGFMNQWAGYSDNEGDNGAANYSEVGTFSDAEVHFSGSTKLDNGLTVAVKIEAERSGGTDGVSDDTFLSVSSDALGTVKIGSTKGAAYGFNTLHGDVGLGLSGTDATTFAQNSLGNDLSTETSGSDGHKVVYLTPNFGGVQAGVSYGLVNESNVGSANLQTSGNDIQYDAAIAYSGDFDGVTVGADLSYVFVEYGGLTGGGVASSATDGTATSSIDQIKNEETLRGGVSVGVAGFTVTAAYLEKDNVGGVTDKDSEAWEAGVAYATGPYAVSLGYLSASNDDSGLSSAKEDESELWILSGSRDLGAGVSVAASVFNVDTDDASDNSANQTDEGSNWGVAAGVTVSF
ncbi:putative Porin [Candidatus Terasakiella magnetica]|uniref:Putative Porin n=1 Tax=Candidatus Terasakiella magnetica TaxID=1867952 RepID=A0A1C3RGH6_9PROT|nr:porin [Candidatus Terasakiella magnetica]SCA56369.1 putative Porin [Candidatus Terasakiella magnetica]